MEERKWRKRRGLQEEHGHGNILHHMETAEAYKGHEAKLVNYDINGQRYCQGVTPAPPPEQNPRAHWLCQVNGNTGEFNIITGGAPNRHVLEYERGQRTRYRETTKAKGDGIPSYLPERRPVAAGQVQPQKVVSCEGPNKAFNFVPVYQHPLMGEAARRSSLSFLK